MDTERVNVDLLENFGGLFSDADPADVPEGKLWRQLNVLSIRNGELTTRGGLADLALDTLE